MDTRVRTIEPWALLSLVLLGEILLGIAPSADRTTWLLENLPVFALLPVVLVYQPKVRLTRFTLRLLVVHALVLMVGGYYTYAQVPLGFWMQGAFGFSRNHYDRIGHFMQGFVPAIVFRELLLKKSPLVRGKLLTCIVVSICLALSAVWELLEWLSAVVLGQGADAFLGTQGDPWDTQEDMAMALVGALVATLALAGWHDRALRRQSAVH
jgi:putative membrane protein